MAKFGIDTFGLTIATLVFAAISGSMVAGSSLRIRRVGEEGAEAEEIEREGQIIGRDVVVISDEAIGHGRDGEEGEK